MFSCRDRELDGVAAGCSAFDLVLEEAGGLDEVGSGVGQESVVFATEFLLVRTGPQLQR